MWFVDDSIHGGDGADTWTGNGGGYTNTSGGSDYYIFGRTVSDTISYGDDTDYIFGNEGYDFATGDEVDDAVYVGACNNTLGGNAGDETLEGEDDDRFIGGSRDSYLVRYNDIVFTPPPPTTQL